MYTLNADTLLRQRVSFEPVAVTAELGSGITVTVVCNDCDTISQVKQKLLHGLTVEQAQALRDPVEDGVLQEITSQRLLLDVDASSIKANKMVRLNTLKHYSLKTEVTVRLISAKAAGAEALAASKKRKQRRFSFANDSKEHDGEHRWHLVRVDEMEQGVNKVPSEIFLSYLMTVKMTVQPFVDQLIGNVFGDDEQPAVVVVLFKYLDQLAAEHGITDPEVLHVWKNNAVPLRFWINLIKNPEFLFDMEKTHAVNSCLSTIAQVIMDACSPSEQQLGKHSPANKHLYRAEVAKYKGKVVDYYRTVSQETKTPTTEDIVQMGERNDLQGFPAVAPAVEAFIRYCVKYEAPILVSFGC